MAIPRRIAASLALCAMAAPFLPGRACCGPIGAIDGPVAAGRRRGFMPGGDAGDRPVSGPSSLRSGLPRHVRGNAKPGVLEPDPGLDIQDAYALPSSTAGAGKTVAIVDAYNLPTAEADLGVYRSQSAFRPCTTANGCFRKVNQDGNASPLPATDAGWGQEIALDMDMVSAVVSAAVTSCSWKPRTT